ncbi:hypothetical protein [Actinoplanes regularis]|uniref:Lipoprotein n=1 Tax=Actinoplanes regularis TaxID=52697 RepID=A0A239II99_9ACTN|nr:hypothetical protein [Actinoplanes regularis]GIE91552.1 hypothetical protein Are01nite_80320 [Actinoplanes regularis]SNS92743.1 hypothetical protein SAMN06264365_12914 [Actinoplanes regularis]
MTIRAWGAATATLTAGLLLAGCQGLDRAKPVPPPVSLAPSSNGVETLPVEQALERTQNALRGADSFRFNGCRGKRVGGPWDCAEYQSVGNDFIGLLKPADGEGDILAGRAEILSVGGHYYMRPDAAWWEQEFDDTRAGADAIVKYVGDRWVDTEKFPRYGAVFRPAAVIAELDSIDKVAKGGSTEVNGQAAFSFGVEKSFDSIVVAATGEPYPLQLNLFTTTAALSDFGTEFGQIAAPPAESVVDLTTVLLWAAKH